MVELMLPGLSRLPQLENTTLIFSLKSGVFSIPVGFKAEGLKFSTTASFVSAKAERPPGRVKANIAVFMMCFSISKNALRVALGYLMGISICVKECAGKL